MKTFVPILMTAGERQQLLAAFDGTDVIERFPAAAEPPKPETGTARAMRGVTKALAEAGMLPPEPRSR